MDGSISLELGPPDLISTLTVHDDEVVTPASAGKVTPALAGIVKPESSGNKSLSSPVIDGREQMEIDEKTVIKRDAAINADPMSESICSKKLWGPEDFLVEPLLPDEGEITLPEPRNESKKKKGYDKTFPSLEPLEEEDAPNLLPSTSTTVRDEKWWATLLYSNPDEHFLPFASVDQRRNYADIIKNFRPEPIPPILPTDGSRSLIFLAYQAEVDKWKTEVLRSLEEIARDHLKTANYLQERISKQASEITRKRASLRVLAKEVERLRAVEYRQKKLCKSISSTSKNPSETPVRKRHPASSSLVDGPPTDPQPNDQETAAPSVGFHS